MGKLLLRCNNEWTYNKQFNNTKNIKKIENQIDKIYLKKVKFADDTKIEE